MQIDTHCAALGIEAVASLRISDLCDHLSRNLLIVNAGVRADFSKNVDLIGGAGDLAGHMGFRILPQQLIEDAVSDLIADLIGVPPCHRLRSKYAFHRKEPPLLF